MNPYLEPHGFLGTGASLLADITLLAYLILIIPAMIVGFGFARRKLFRPYHKVTMTAITVVNWVLIIFLMLFAYRFDVADNIGPHTGNTRYLLPTIHGIIGLVAQLLATYVLFRMYREDIQVARAKARGEKDTSKYWFTSAKPIMRLTLTLWLITSVLGVFNYLIRYDIIPTYQLSAKVVAPAATPEAFAAPLSTPEVGAPISTAEVTVQAPVSTEAATAQPPAKTPEAPAETMQPPVVTVEVFVPMITVEIVTATPSPTSRPPVATPEILAPNVTEELITPGSTASPIRTVRAPAATPEVKPPVATEAVSNTPTATQPPTQAIRPLIATPELHAPAATEELTAATSTPTSTPTCVITPTVRPPVTTEDMSEFTNTPTATNTPDCLPTPTPTITPTCVIMPIVRLPVATEDLGEFTNTPTAISTPTCSTMPTVRAPVSTPEVTATATPYGWIGVAPLGD